MMAPQKLTPKERELACSIAMDTAAELINAVCMNEGSRVVKINSDAASVSFAVPPEVMDKINGNPGMTLEEATETLYHLPWSEGWSSGIAAMVYGKEEWARMSPSERERIQKRLIREKLAPVLVT